MGGVRVSPPPPPVVEMDPLEARSGLHGRRIGPHVAVGDGWLRAAERARTLGASAIQVFTDDPKAWAPRSGDIPGLERFRVILDAADIELVVHGSYLVNLASPDPLVHARSVARVRQELAAAAVVGARAVTVHVGSHRGAGVGRGTELAAEAIARILDDTPAVSGRSDPAARLVLETSAGQGDSLGVTIEELGAIEVAAERHGVDPRRLGVCLDTAHLWAAGYGLDDPDAIDELLHVVDATLGSDALAMVHLNDSRASRGSRQDRHENLEAGRIGVSGLSHLVRHPRLAEVPVILETPGLDAGWDAVDMARVRAYLSVGTTARTPVRTAVAVPAEGGGGARTHMVGSAPEPA
jgi:deoxyribonuclease IV